MLLRNQPNIFSEELSMHARAVHEPEPEPVVPAEAHCLRTAVLSAEIGRRLNLSSHVLGSLEEAAVNHHAEAAAEGQSGALRLLDDLATLHHSPQKLLGRPLSKRATAILQNLNSWALREGCQPEVPVSVLRLANAFDEAFEWRIFEGQLGTELLDEFGDLRGMEMWPAEVDGAFQSLSAGNLERALKNAEKLPVSTVAAVRKLATMRLEDLQLEALESIAKADPALAADVIRASNAGCFATQTRFSKIRDAIRFIGVVRAREVLIASAARGLFGSSGLRELWKHSVRAAVKMRDLAQSAGLDPEEAFTLGLLHDIGRSAFETAGAASTLRAKLRETGAPEVWIDIVTMGCDHAEAGAGLLATWGFPQSMVDAVRFHHCPERSDGKLAAAMYLVEVAEDGNEDLPGAGRKAAAARKLDGYSGGIESSMEESADLFGIAV